MKRHNRLRTLAAAGLLVCVTACGGAPSSSTDDDSDGLTKVNLTVLPIANVAPVQLAIDQGFFADEGLDVTVSYATTGAAIVPGVLNGSVDIGYTNLPAIMLAGGEGLPLVSIASGDANAPKVTERDNSAVIVRKDSGITDAAGLDGKTVAVNALGGLIYVLTRASADALGGDSSTTDFAEIPFPDMLGALQDGRIDAASVVEPFLTIALKSGDFSSVLNTGSIGGTQPGLVYNTYFTSEQTLKAKPDVIEGFQSAIYAANAYASENEEDVRAAIGEYTETDPALLDKIRLVSWPDSKVTEENYNTLVSLMEEYGLITDATEVPSYDEFILG